jgi:hypothetical protein
MPYHRLFYQFVWTTKHRLPLIGPANQESIYAAIRAKAEELNGIVHALNLITPATIPASKRFDSSACATVGPRLAYRMA